jgi:hypothetical protein
MPGIKEAQWNMKSLPAGLQVDELVELHMANSNIEQLWYGCKVRSTNLRAFVFLFIVFP